VKYRVNVLHGLSSPVLGFAVSTTTNLP